MRRALILSAFLLVAGCSTAERKAVAVVREGRALLRHPAPGDSDWEERRATFMRDADEVAPATTSEGK